MPAVQKFARSGSVAVLACGLLVAGLPAKAGDWSGFFLGNLMTGYSTAGPAPILGGNSGQGMRMGYTHDLGNVVLGGELAYLPSPTSLTGTGMDEVESVSLRAGYDFGSTLGYITVGNLQDQAQTGTDENTVLGLGIAYSVNQDIQLSGEVTRQQIEGSTAGSFETGSILSMRASFRF